MGRIYDVSMDIHPGMTVWPGDEGVTLERTQSMEAGAHANLSRMACGVHTGTHVDAPLHFLRDGGTVDGLRLDWLIGSAWVADCSAMNRIGADDLDAAGIPAGTERLLFKTANSRIPQSETAFREDYSGLEESGAEWIVRRRIRLIGVDYLSVAVRDQTGPVHRVLLGAAVILVEGLRLGEISEGECKFCCLPLKLMGAEGAPARAIIER